jgi:acetyl/propionyl-CoA carboxylase alpha subunit
VTGLSKLLVANRGEIALRVFRAAGTLGITTVGVYPADDADSLHVTRCDEAVQLPGTGAAAYLDVAAVAGAARQAGADSLHPGYGFLSESAALARACADAGLTFVGPEPEALDAFGDKGAARELAAAHGIPVVPGTRAATTLPEMEKFLQTLDTPAAVIKAVAGGGGRGLRIVRGVDELPAAVAVCLAEAGGAFGNDDLYIECLVENARHVEVQILGDGTGEVVHLWDRDCSVQRRHQKIIEMAPARGLDPAARDGMLDAARRLTAALRYRGLATVEFLATSDGGFFFLEVNPRVQVEHTVTEEITGTDLVRAQIQVAAGATLASLGLTQPEIGEPRGCAIQVRVNAETMTADGQVLPEAGRAERFEMPSGHGIRVETAGYAGYPVSPRFDSLLAKIIVHDRSGFEAARRSALRALAETRIAGVGTNLALDHAILASAQFASGACDTRYVDTHVPELLQAARSYQPRPAPGGDPATAGSAASTGIAAPAARTAAAPPPGVIALTAPMGGSVTAIEVVPGDAVRSGQLLLTLEAMKMQHALPAGRGGEVAAILVSAGDVVAAGDPLVYLLPGEPDGEDARAVTELDLDLIRPDLAKVLSRAELLADSSRPDAVRKRHSLGLRTARENVADLVDAGSFTEYGGFAVAAQRSRRDLGDLIRNTPADGIITGVGRVNGGLFPPERSSCAVLAYDYTVLAGTQGYFNHRKTDRVLRVARDCGYPVILFAEGGGGRPGDVDVPKGGGLTTPTFTAFGALSGSVPTVGIVAGRCFAGNAALLGSCDVVIATRDSNIGMGGPAMIEGGGLGAFAPGDIGPIGVQTANGVVDIAVADEAEAVAAAKQYLSYFQGSVTCADDADVADQRRLRHVVPEDRKRVYDVHRAIEVLCDAGSVLELRPAFGQCVVTALVRIGGRPMGLIANNPMVLGGAIDSGGADKAARFLQLCEVFGLPIVSLVDTPGFMVGPESEKTATVRHFGRMFVRGGNLTVPLAAVVLRKSYGLGAMAMAGGSLHDPVLTVAWPTGEFGGMGLEGAVRLGFRKELEAITDPAERERHYEELVARMYERGSALNTAMYLETDDVIDPARTRDALLASLPPVPREGWVNPRARPFIDAW